MTNLELFELSKNNKKIATVKVIKWDFIKNYIYIFLVPFTIYKIIYYAIIEQNLPEISNLTTSIELLDKYTKEKISRANSIFIMEILVILCLIGIVFISSGIIFSKYTSRKDDFKKILKTTIILQIILSTILTFDFTVNYLNESNFFALDGNLLEKYEENTEEFKIINETKVRIKSIEKKYFLTSISSCLIISTICIFLQRKIIKDNCN